MRFYKKNNIRNIIWPYLENMLVGMFAVYALLKIIRACLFPDFQSSEWVFRREKW